MYMIFVNLAVRDLEQARAFYEGVGFSFNRHWSDDRTATYGIDSSIVVKLRTRETFAELIEGEAGELGQGPTVVHELGVRSRDEVDEVVALAEAAGGRTWFHADEPPTTHTGSFADPDGHIWQLTWMEPVHAID